MPNLNVMNSTPPKGVALSTLSGNKNSAAGSTRDLPDNFGAPEYLRIPEACRCFGFSKSGLYRLAKEQKLRLVKLGGSTLVDCASARDLLASLPVA